MMNKKFVFVLIVGILAASSSHAATAGGGISPASLDAYLKIQTSLAGDSMDGVSSAATEIAAKATNSVMKSSAKTLSRDKSIEDARKHFKSLSKLFVQWAKVKKPQGIDRIYCPMAKASWLQKSGDIRNPYYGKQMLECGTIEN